MRFAFLTLPALLLTSNPIWANQDALRLQALSHVRAAASSVEIHIPSTEVSMEESSYGEQLYGRPEGHELFPRLSHSVVFIVAEGGITGAGTVISSSFGLIATSWHLVGSQKFVSVVFKPRGAIGPFSFDKEDIYFARVLATDSIRDLAVLELVSPPGKMIAAPLGSTQDLRAGRGVFSISHRRGALWTYSEGIIRELTPRYEWVRGLGMVHRADTIHTQTISNTGSSGEPLFDRRGQFIGLMVGGAVDEPNFAVSIDELRKFVFSALR